MWRFPPAPFSGQRREWEKASRCQGANLSGNLVGVLLCSRLKVKLLRCEASVSCYPPSHALVVPNSVAPFLPACVLLSTTAGGGVARREPPGHFGSEGRRRVSCQGAQRAVDASHRARAGGWGGGRNAARLRALATQVAERRLRSTYWQRHRHRRRRRRRHRLYSVRRVSLLCGESERRGRRAFARGKHARVVPGRRVPARCVPQRMYVERGRTLTAGAEGERER